MGAKGTGDAIVVPLSDTVAGAEVGTSRWIAINWTSLGGESREFNVTAQGSEGVDVSYPTHPPYALASNFYDDPNGYFAFNFRDGSHTLEATPFGRDSGLGEAGTPPRQLHLSALSSWTTLRGERMAAAAPACPGLEWQRHSSPRPRSRPG